MASRSFSFVAIFLVACSGAGNEDLFGSPPNRGVAAIDPPKTTMPNPPADKNKGSGSATPPSSSGGGNDQGQDNDNPPACTKEVEPNDTMKNATPFTSSFCGQIATKGDVDYGKIIAPANAKRMKYTVTSPDGKLTWRLYADGIPMPDEATAAMAIPGATYTFELSQTPGSGGHPSYEVDVTFD
jgi:hypothetical protein